MFDLYAAGGTYMPVLTLLGLTVFVLAIKHVVDTMRGTSPAPSKRARGTNLMLHLGIFAFFVGVFSHLVGLLMALQVIETTPAVNPALLATGLKTSLVAPIFGTLILLLSLLVWSILRYKSAPLTT
ncbi:MAG: hypothetical protein RhofKO_26380 [Rhodothermales bacterium]